MLISLGACGRVGFEHGPDANRGVATTEIVVQDFRDCSSIVLLGSATCEGGELVLTTDSPDIVGAAWLGRLPIDSHTNFSIQVGWSFRATTPRPADGATITIHGDPAGNNAIGHIGGTLGINDILPSVSLELDTNGGGGLDPDFHHAALNQDGVVDAYARFAATPFALTAVPSFTVWLDYAGSTQLIEVYVSQSPIKPPSATLTAIEDLTRLGPLPWVGVTAATGQAHEAHVVTSFAVDHEP